MISKNRSSRFAHGLAAAVLAVGFTAACGDDDPTVVEPDANGPDAEEPCEGHACPSTSPTMMLPEGGELRYELFHIGNDAEGNRTEILGGWTFLFNGQTPDYRAILGPLTEGEGIVYPGGAAYCFNQTEANYYLSGWSQKGQDIADTRAYYDVGESLTLTRDGAGDLPMPRREPGTSDPSTLLQHGVIYLTEPEAAADLQRGVTYPALNIGPVGDFPGLDLRGGVDVPSNSEWTDPPALYMPHDFTLTSPTEAEYFNPQADGGLLIDRTQDLVFAWDQEENPAGWATQVQFTGFLNADQTFQYLCITLNDGTPENSMQTIPQGLFDVEGFPTEGKLIHGSLTHVAWSQRVNDDEEYRFDIVGVNCKFSWFSLVTP